MNRRSFPIAITIMVIAILAIVATAFDPEAALLESYNTQTELDTGVDSWWAEQIRNDRLVHTEFDMDATEQRKFMEAHGYQHDKFFTADGQLTAPTLAQLQLAAKLAGAAYCVSRNAQALADWKCKACPTTISMSSTTVYKLDGYEIGVYVGYDSTNKIIRVVFRGSANFSNWMANLNFGKVSLGSGKGEVHSGFRTAYLQARANIVSKITSLRSTYSNPPVQVTGHSLGGATALLAALDLKTGLTVTEFANGITHVSSELFPEPLPFSPSQLTAMGATTILQTFPMSGPLITFGQPRVGDQTFANWANGQLSSIGYFRVTHRQDPVPRVPTQAMGFAHINPTEIYFTDADGSTNYKICASGSAEDKTCILSPLVNLNIGDHSWYAGVYLTQTDATCAAR